MSQFVSQRLDLSRTLPSFARHRNERLTITAKLLINIEQGLVKTTSPAVGQRGSLTQDDRRNHRVFIPHQISNQITIALFSSADERFFPFFAGNEVGDIFKSSERFVALNTVMPGYLGQ